MNDITADDLADIAEHFVGKGVDIPVDALKDNVHAVVTQNAREGVTDYSIGNVLEQAIGRTVFMKGFNWPY